MKKCPKCKALIDDDSLFCDQCGQQLMICPQPKALKADDEKTVDLREGAIIGRRGDYPDVFAGHSDVSGNHARIGRIGNDWTITDVGSTNGTTFNGRELPANVEQKIKIGDKISFSTYAFTVV